MFKKKAPKPGPTFPFIENKDGKISLTYDAIKVTFSGGMITMTYMQGEVPIYAYTYEANGDHEIIFEGMKGSVDVTFVT